MTSVEQAENIILHHTKNYGSLPVAIEQALGRILAESLFADRDLPPCNRSTMDGIAIPYSAFENGLRTFTINGIIAAGERPANIAGENECAEIMTGGALPDGADTVVRYEDVEIKNGSATIKVEAVKKGQNVHLKGRDKKKGDVVAMANKVVDATAISMAASVGKNEVLVKKLPSVVIISTGGELVGISETPTDYQVRSSNSYTAHAVLEQYHIMPDILHIPDVPEITREQLGRCLSEYDVIILTGGVSMGKFDYVPQVLEELKVTKFFHKVQQRPGKPFWFGAHENTLVFAFPGNPVSTFLCLHRYFIPWLEASLGIVRKKSFAVLDGDITFAPSLQYFVQVSLHVNDEGKLVAIPNEGNGSGDFANLLETDAFMELPAEKSNFKKGEVYRIWPFKQWL